MQEQKIYKIPKKSYIIYIFPLLYNKLSEISSGDFISLTTSTNHLGIFQVKLFVKIKLILAQTRLIFDK